MKAMLKIHLAALLLGLLFAWNVRADDQAPVQNGPSIQADKSGAPDSGEAQARPRVMSPNRLLQMLTKRLGLSGDQQAKILPLLQAQQGQFNALRNDTALSNDAKRDKVRDIRQSTMQQIGALLTPEQRQKLKDLRAAQGEQRPPPGEAPPPPPGR